MDHRKAVDGLVTPYSTRHLSHGLAEATTEPMRGPLLAVSLVVSATGWLNGLGSSQAHRNGMKRD